MTFAIPMLPLLVAVAATEATAPSPPSVVPPQVVQATPAVYPTGRHEAAEVSLRVLVDATGKVGAVEVTKSGGPDFDAAATAAVLKWRFEPAKLNGTPFEAHIRIPFLFRPPLEAAVPDGGAAAADGGAAGPDGGATRTQTPTATASTPSQTQAPLPAVTPVPAPAPAPAPAPTSTPEEVQVRGAQKKVDRGGSDFQITVGQLATIAAQSPEELLQLAPGIFIANEGGAGHADQVFLRGFDAETGQGIEFTVNGVPINEVDNTDGHGYADTHFIIPEVVKELRVIEGPFDPHQGDFAEAGSVEYELGVTDRRLQISAEYGSFDTERALALWAPQGERDGTFAAVQAEQSAGYGENRAYTTASAIAQYEGDLGRRGLWRALVTAYATNFQSAGVVRADDVASGAVGFYGSEDPSQGGAAQRYTASFSLEDPIGDGLITQQLFLTWRTLTLDEDFTGFLLDTIQPGQTPHIQRGDGILQQYTALTPGARGSYKLTKHWFGEDQSVELGYYARYDHTTPSIDRVEFGTQIPYLVDEDLVTDVFNIAGYLDLDLHIGKRLTLRGGVRQEYFNYDINNLCAVTSNQLTQDSAAQGQLPNVACPTFENGPRLPNLPIRAGGEITEPKATALYQLSSQFTATGSFGIGATSQDATVITQNEQTPFTQIVAGELGLKYHGRFDRADLSGRLVGYYTHTSADLYFDPDQGRLSPAPGTERGGGVFEARLAGPWYDELASATYAYAVYDSASGASSTTASSTPITGGSLVPYVPNLVARSDTVFFHPLPWRLADMPILGKVGLGLNYVGERALPLGQFAAPTFVLDASAKVRWSFIELGIVGENLLNSQYALSEFFYASYFPHGATQSYPTFAPTEAFTAAPPLTLLATLSLVFDKESFR